MVLNLEIFAQLPHGLIVQVATIISDDLVGDPITADYFFLDELSHHLSCDVGV